MKQVYVALLVLMGHQALAAQEINQKLPLLNPDMEENIIKEDVAKNIQFRFIKCEELGGKCFHNANDCKGDMPLSIDNDGKCFYSTMVCCAPATTELPPWFISTTTDGTDTSFPSMATGEPGKGRSADGNYNSGIPEGPDGTEATMGTDDDLLMFTGEPESPPWFMSSAEGPYNSKMTDGTEDTDTTLPSMATGKPVALRGFNTNVCGTDFQCAKGGCIPGHQWCDYNDDCGDNSDEINCPMFTCSNGRKIMYKWYCNGYDNCGDNSDETTNCKRKSGPTVWACEASWGMCDWFEVPFGATYSK